MKDLIKKYADKYGLDPAIVYGICVKESCLNPKDPPSKWRLDTKATRFEKNWHYFYRSQPIPGVTDTEEQRDQATSWGLMQVMGSVLREHGYKGVIPDILNDVEAQLDYGCKHLLKKIGKYGLYHGILAYNTGSPRMNMDGSFVNEGYLRRVIQYSKGY
ncbi:MAG: transglycosylase SLT domain-containing protein [Desulfatirhabdiaceae bacterium]